MKAASAKDIKSELLNQSHQQLVEHCLRLCRFKKENKELLTYRLFEMGNETAYVDSVKALLQEEFATINKKNIYFAKKSIRKIIRAALRFIRYSEEPTVEAELLLFVCTEMKQSGLLVANSTALQNIYFSQIKKLTKAISGLHPDLQHDFSRKLDQL